MVASKYKVEHAGCPIAFASEAFGDKWTLLILREVLIFGKKYFDEILAMREGIATNILAARLKEMECSDLLVKREDPANGRRFIYAPTEKALDLIPACVELILWASKHDPATAVPARQIELMRRSRAKAIRELRAPFE